MIAGAGGFLVVALRFAVLTATIGVVGAWTFIRFVLPTATGEAIALRRDELMRASMRLAIACAGVILLANVPRLVAQAQSLNDAGDPLGPAIWSVLQTHWGWALCVQAVAATVAMAALRAGGSAGRRTRVAELSVVVLTVVPAFMGHAIADPDHRWLSVLVDIVHVAAAGGWLGALSLLAFSAWRLRHDGAAPALIASLVVAFHPIAMVTAGTVFVTGLGTAWLRMGAPAGIADQAYSGLFVAKLLLVGVAAAIGAGHAKQAKRRVKTVDTASINRTLLGEALFAVLVLAVTAVLAGTSPIG